MTGKYYYQRTVDCDAYEKKIRIEVTHDGRIFVAGQEYTDEYYGWPIDMELMDELERLVRSGEL